jgi:hypothetical protein
MTTKEQCKKQIVKIAENNVELQYYLLSPNDYSKVVIDQYTEGYGQTRITDDRVQADEDWAFWDGLDAPGIAAKITEAADEVSFYDKIQDCMDAEDGTVIELD